MCGECLNAMVRLGAHYGMPMAPVVEDEPDQDFYLDDDIEEGDWDES